jgi:hypothetical protein
VPYKVILTSNGATVNGPSKDEKNIEEKYTEEWANARCEQANLDAAKLGVKGRYEVAPA